MRILGIETSCDETAASVIEEYKILSNIISSQIVHKKYGGIVPEFASREQIGAIVPIVEAALVGAETSLNDIDGIAVTCGPGLAGSLLTGLNFTKGLSLASEKNYISGQYSRERCQTRETDPAQRRNRYQYFLQEYVRPGSK